MPGRAVRIVAAAALALTPLVAGCGTDPAPSGPKPTAAAAGACQEQWREVGESVLGLDEDTRSSSLTSRWTSVIATVDYYENSATAADCQETVDAQVKAIADLRLFNDKLRPFDMPYQVSRFSAGVDIYLHEPVPEGARDDDGHRIKAPTHAAVTTAWATLNERADEADTELAPGWGQLATVNLGEEDEVAAALADLDAVAQAGTAWRECQQALQVIATAIRAQENAP